MQWTKTGKGWEIDMEGYEYAIQKSPNGGYYTFLKDGLVAIGRRKSLEGAKSVAYRDLSYREVGMEDQLYGFVFAEPSLKFERKVGGVE